MTINGKRVYKTDIEADNGLIHLLNDVVYPFPLGNIMEVIRQDDHFSTLLSAIEAADLADTLSIGGPFTLFAPTNNAFTKLPKADLDALLADKEALTKVLLRHVLPGTLFSTGVTWSTHETAGNDTIATQVFKTGIIRVASNTDGERLGAWVVNADIIATNGVVHAIDTII